jgi:MFS family permease
VAIVRSSNQSSDGAAAEPVPRHRPGTLRAALARPAFRRVWLGSLASNVGTWMQNITLGILAYDLTGEAWFIGVLTFAQLGPMLVLSPVGGAVADRVDRRVLMVTIAASQTVLSLALAWVALADRPDEVALVVLVALIGIGGALNGPVAAATLPALAGREDLQAAVALNSAAMNASRVVGPVLGGVVAGVGGASLVFAVNAATYLFVIAAVCTARADFSASGKRGVGPLRQLREGFRAARADRVVTRVLVTIAVYSLCSLVFIYQMPKIAAEQFGLEGVHYTLLFACFALGAVSGALAMGSAFANLPRSRMTRGGLAAFAVALAAFALTGSPAVAFPTVFVTGASYFVVVTALSTTLQMRVDDSVRGRVMGLWMMGWAGLVPVGGLIAGPVIDAVGMVPVLLFGAAVAAVLAATMDLREPDLEAVGAA